jgi:hypothetical protein|tara:strand:- start:919 stop:1089 length:171 start_codon:yes stop_codon:yes gene_type:complete
MNTFTLLANVYIAVAICFAVIGFTTLNTFIYTAIPFFTTGVVMLIIGVKKSNEASK